MSLSYLSMQVAIAQGQKNTNKKNPNSLHIDFDL